MKLVINLLLLFVLSTTAAFGQASTTLVKSIAADGVGAISLELPGRVSINEWENKFVRVTVNIEINNSTEEILKRLITVGRYDISSSSLTNGQLNISMPKVAHFVSIKGVDLTEIIQFEVQIPAGVKTSVKNTSVSPASAQSM